MENVSIKKTPQFKVKKILFKKVGCQLASKWYVHDGSCLHMHTHAHPPTYIHTHWRLNAKGQEDCHCRARQRSPSTKGCHQMQVSCELPSAGGTESQQQQQLGMKWLGLK